MARLVLSDEDIEIIDSDNEGVPPAVSTSVDFMEVFSPLRIAPECMKLGLTVGPSVDQRTGFDLSNDSDRARVLALVHQLRPRVLMACAPCSMFSSLNRMWNFKNMSPQTKQPKIMVANTLFEYGMLLCRVQANGDRFYLHEHPGGASSWHKQSAQVFIEQTKGHSCRFHQCRFGLRAPCSLRPVKKPTKLITNNADIYKRFHQKYCKCGSIAHVLCTGSHVGRAMSTHCAIYPKGLCMEVAQAVFATCRLQA